MPIHCIGTYNSIALTHWYIIEILRTLFSHQQGMRSSFHDSSSHWDSSFYMSYSTNTSDIMSNTEIESDWLIVWCFMLLSTVSVILQWQLTLFMSSLGFTSTRLGFEVSCPRTLPRKEYQRIQSGWNSGSLDYESNTLPLSHTGPLK